VKNKNPRRSGEDSHNVHIKELVINNLYIPQRSDTLLLYTEGMICQYEVIDMYGVPICSCKTEIKPRWTRDKPRALICARCGCCVPGYEPLWIQREKERLTKNDK